MTRTAFKAGPENIPCTFFHILFPLASVIQVSIANLEANEANKDKKTEGAFILESLLK